MWLKYFQKPLMLSPRFGSRLNSERTGKMIRNANTYKSDDVAVDLTPGCYGATDRFKLLDRFDVCPRISRPENDLAFIGMLRAPCPPLRRDNMTAEIRQRLLPSFG